MEKLTTYKNWGTGEYVAYKGFERIEGELFAKVYKFKAGFIERENEILIPLVKFEKEWEKL